MGIISKRKNKKFNYRPRHFEHDGDGSPFSIEHKFDKFRSTVGDNKSLKGKFKTAWGELRSTSDKNTRFRLFVIIAVLILLFLFIIEFDLSIFYL
ncbi:riboflavin synthase subunit beta [Aequorivita sp. H23M31]|uniref:Riboflavin synthase subunit beta n=1 Tax=Aequorivita ciconiae TaxID=2494375 RepID=A0A410G275_9FLAO|nr:riboflavin synthase subunit beta [Aequorivita sp. H23M31]